MGKNKIHDNNSKKMEEDVNGAILLMRFFYGKSYNIMSSLTGKLKMHNMIPGEITKNLYIYM